MMLQYQENINYSKPSQYNIDEQLSELTQCCKNGYKEYQIYKQIRNYVYRQIKIKELAVTTILEDLLQIYDKNKRGFEIVCYFIANNLSSYKDIADYFCVSKQNVYQVISTYADRYNWLKTLVEIKGEQDAHNENNRTVFYKSRYFESKRDNTMNLFQDDTIGEI